MLWLLLIVTTALVTWKLAHTPKKKVDDDVFVEGGEIEIADVERGDCVEIINKAAEAVLKRKPIKFNAF